MLDIRSSILQSRWVFPPSNDEVIQRMMSDYKIPEIVARLLASRNVRHEQVDNYLNPKLARDFPDPHCLKGMEEFADCVSGEIIKGTKIAAFCDFDVDGSTSAAILKKFFRHIGQDLTIYIPCRMNEGYGPNTKALRQLKDDGHDFVIMADCGTNSCEVIEEANSFGLKVCILDHHEAGEEMAPALHLVNPKRKDCQSGLTMLAACGVTFLACVAINTKLRAKEFYKDKNLAEPPLKNWLDLVALGTVCDMVPLTGPNRLFVKVGFEQMAMHNNIGLKALCEVGNIKKTPTSQDAGFILGPRINAGSRVHKSDLGALLLSSEDAEEAKNLAWLLNDCNTKRRDIQKEMLKDAVRMVEINGYQDDPIILVHDESWHVGLNGLVAGQIKERFGKPACAIAFAVGMDGKLEGRGSGRSVPGFNMAALFMAAKEAGLVIKGGGHAMAAGFTVYPENIPALHDFFKEHAAKIADQNEFIVEDNVDGIATIRGLRPDFVRLLENNVGPFGQENPEPKFVLSHVKIVNVDVVGTDHVRLQISDIAGGSRMKAMAFKSADTPLGQALLNGRGQNIHLMGQFKINEWNGMESVEFHVSDAAYALEAAE